MNLLHRSSINYLAVWLGPTVYLRAASTADVLKLPDFTRECDQVLSFAWVNKGSTIAIGASSGIIHIYDAVRSELLRSYHTHAARCGSKSWNGPTLSSGFVLLIDHYVSIWYLLPFSSRDSTIQYHDDRQLNPLAIAYTLSTWHSPYAPMSDCPVVPTYDH